MSVRMHSALAVASFVVTIFKYQKKPGSGVLGPSSPGLRYYVTSVAFKNSLKVQVFVQIYSGSAEGPVS